MDRKIVTDINYTAKTFIITNHEYINQMARNFNNTSKHKLPQLYSVSMVLALLYQESLNVF